MWYAGMQRILLWERRNNTVQPFNETVQQVFARISALRDRLDGPVVSLHLSHQYQQCLYQHAWRPSMQPEAKSCWQLYTRERNGSVSLLVTSR